VLNVADGRPIGTSMGVDLRGDSVNRAAFSPDGRLIVTAQRDGSAVLWSADGHRRLMQLGFPGAPTPHNELNDVAFSSDSRLLVMSGGDRVVRMFDTRTGKAMAPFMLPKAPVDDAFSTTGVDHAVRAVALQPHGTVVAAGDADGFVHLWDRRDPAVHRMLPVGGKVTALAFSPDGALLATAAGGDAKLWDVSTGQPVSTITYGMSSVTGIGFSRDGRMVLGADGVIRMFDCELCGSNADLQKVAKQLVQRTLTREERATNLPEGLR
jgi:WD40 repeat protein